MLKIDNSIGLITISNLLENNNKNNLNFLNTVNTGLSLRIYLPQIFYIPLIPNINRMYFDIYTTLINILNVKSFSTESQILGLNFNFPLPSILKLCSLEICAGAQYMCNSKKNNAKYLQFLNVLTTQNYFVYIGINLLLSFKIINFKISILRAMPIDTKTYKISFNKYQDLFLKEIYS